jgi:hypothetical protein
MKLNLINTVPDVLPLRELQCIRGHKGQGPVTGKPRDPSFDFGEGIAFLDCYADNYLQPPRRVLYVHPKRPDSGFVK